MPPRKCCGTKACSGVRHSRRRHCVDSDVISPPRWFREPWFKKIVMSRPQQETCKCNSSQPGGNCSCQPNQEPLYCPNTSCDKQKLTNKDLNSRRVLQSAPTPLGFADAGSNADVTPCRTCLPETPTPDVREPEYPCQTCPAEAAKLALNDEGSYPAITCSKDCMQVKSDQPSDFLYQDSQNSAKIQTDSEYNAVPCAHCRNDQTSTSDVVPQKTCSAKKSANMQYEKQCPETCFSKLAASTSCGNWTEMVRDMVKENIKSLMNLQCDCAKNCSSGKDAVTAKTACRRNSKDVPAATNTIDTSDQATCVTVARVESKQSVNASQPSKLPNGVRAENVCAADCQLGQACTCCYPPAFKQVCCTGLITGTCDCGKHC